MYTASSGQPEPRQGRRRPLLLLLITFCCQFLLLLPVHTRAEDVTHIGTIGSSCQTVCACKWKGGKQTAECIDRALITIPTAIDANTQVLDMSGNNLQTLSADTFVRAGLVNLQRLYLRNCRISDIDADALRGLTNLIELDLSHNLLTAVPPNVVLAHVSSLRELTLASNPIHRVEARAFAATHSITKLDLSHCHLATIAPDAFRDLISLHTLKLNHNRLHELRPHTIETLRRLHGVELHDNPWICDCRLRATKIWLTEHRVPYPVAPLCAGGPTRLLQQSFDDVHVNEFACDPAIRPNADTVLVTVRTGDNATFDCHATAVPMGRVDWFWQGRALENGTELNPGAAIRQMVWLWEEGGEFERNSRLVMTNMVKSETQAVYCVVNNPAGSDTVQYVLDVVVRAAGLAVLANREVAGLSAVATVALVGVMLWMMLRHLHRRQPFGETKTPAGAGLADGSSGGGGQMAIVVAVSPTQAMGVTTTTTAMALDHRMYINGGVAGKGIDIERSPADIASGEYLQDVTQQQQQLPSKPQLQHQPKQHEESPVLSTNPLQKPPRIGNDHIGYSVLNAYVYVSPTGSTNTTDNNPDLISSATPCYPYGHRNATDESATAAIDELQLLSRVDAMLSGADAATGHGRPGSGAYSRAVGCDSLYPSGLWPGVGQEAPPANVTNDPAFVQAGSYRHQVGYNNNICMDTNADERVSSPITTKSSEYMCCTFPRSGLNSLNKFAMGGTATLAGLANNGNWGGGGSGSGGVGHGGSSGGYPSDYGLPLVHGSEQLRNSRDVLLQLSQSVQFIASSSHSLASTVPSVAAAGQLGMMTAPATAKSLRVWQRGGVPVLPPVTALKRVLTSSRSSPDEGYQEGCGTDV